MTPMWVRCLSRRWPTATTESTWGGMRSSAPASAMSSNGRPVRARRRPTRRSRPGSPVLPSRTRRSPAASPTPTWWWRTTTTAAIRNPAPAQMRLLPGPASSPRPSPASTALVNAQGDTCSLELDWSDAIPSAVRRLSTTSIVPRPPDSLPAPPTFWRRAWAETSYTDADVLSQQFYSYVVRAEDEFRGRQRSVQQRQ